MDGDVRYIVSSMGQGAMRCHSLRDDAIQISLVDSDFDDFNFVVVERRIR